MTDDAIEVRIGADASGLVNAVGGSKVALQSLSREFEMLRRAVADAAVFQVNEVASLREMQAGLASVAPQAQRAAAEMANFHRTASGGGGGHGGGGFGQVLFEVHALFDELSSGRAHQAIGTFSNLEFILGRMNPLFAVAAGGAVALGAAIFLTVEHFKALQKTMDDIRQAAAFSSNFQIIDPKTLDAVAEKLRSLKTIWNEIGLSDKGFSEEKVAALTSAIAQMANVSNETAQAMGLAMSTMWQQFGENEVEASKGIREVFSKPLAPIDEIAKHLHGLTEEEKARLKAAQETASPLQAQAALVAILAQREANANAAKKSALTEQIGLQQRIVDELARQADPSTFHDQTDFLQSLKDQLKTLEDTNAALDKMSDKMRSAVEPAQNVANAMRDWTKAANPQGAELDKLGEQIKQGQAAVARARQASASEGASLYGGIGGGEDIQKAQAALDILIDKRRKLNDEIGGGDARQKAELANLQAEVAGRANAVEEAKKIRDASAANLGADVSPKFQAEGQKQLLEDEKTLADKKRAYAESQAALEIALTSKNTAARSAAELKLNDLKRQAANGDPTALNNVAAERAKIVQGQDDQRTEESARAIDEEIAKVRDAAAEKVKIYQDDVRQHRVTAQQGADAEKIVLDAEAADLTSLFARKKALYDDANKRGEIEKQLQKELRSIHDEEAQEQRAAADASAKAWETGAQSVLGAWNSNLRGLLSGTENFGTALRKTFADLVVQLIEGFEKFAVSAVLQYTVVQNAATVSSAVQVAANQTAASGGIAALAANAIKAVTIDAGQTFAGVAAFLSPVLGPAALGPAAAAEAAVMGAVASADIGMWNVPSDQLAMIHKNELIMPAAEAGALRTMLSGAAQGSGGGGGDVNHTHTWNISSGSADPRDVARQVAAIWSRNPSFRPAY